MSRSIRVGVFTPEYEPSRGRCPACGATQDDAGCRVVAAWRLGPGVGRDDAPPLSVEHRALRALLDRHPFAMDVDCCDPDLLAEQDAWDRAHQVK